MSQPQFHRVLWYNVLCGRDSLGEGWVPGMQHGVVVGGHSREARTQGEVFLEPHLLLHIAKTVGASGIQPAHPSYSSPHPPLHSGG